MGNPIFDSQTKGNGLFDMIAGVKRMANGNPQGLFEQMYQSNPQFRDFANSMKGKTPEEAFKEKGLDYNQFKPFM